MSKTHKQKLMNFDIEQYVKIVDSHKESHTLSIAEEITRLIDLGLNVKPKLDEIESKIDVISKNIEKMQWFFKYVIAYIKYICIFVSVKHLNTNTMTTAKKDTQPTKVSALYLGKQLFKSYAKKELLKGRTESDIKESFTLDVLNKMSVEFCEKYNFEIVY